MLMKVFLTKVSHKHGTDVFCSATSEGREKHMADYCREWWEDLDWGDGVPAPNLPVSDIDVIKCYWSKVEAAQETGCGQEEDYEYIEYWVEVLLLDELVKSLLDVTDTLVAQRKGWAESPVAVMIAKAYALVERIKAEQPKG